MRKIKVDKKLVEHISKLARVELKESEKEKFVKQFNSILEFFSRIDEVPIKKVEPAFHVEKITNVFREDKVKKFKWNPLANTKHKEKGYFKGPRIV